MKLFELNLAESQTHDVEKIQNFLNDMKISNVCKIKPDGKVDVSGSISISGNKKYANQQDKIASAPLYTDIIELPVKFSTVSGNFFMSACRLCSLKGFPDTTGNSLVFDFNKDIKTFDGLKDAHVGRDLSFKKTGITSLIGIADNFKHIGVSVTCTWSQITEGGLGLLAIDGLKFLAPDLSFSQDLRPPFKIIDKHLQGSRDIFQCQQELIEAGFEEYAQL